MLAQHYREVSVLALAGGGLAGVRIPTVRAWVGHCQPHHKRRGRRIIIIRRSVGKADHLDDGRTAAADGGVALDEDGLGKEGHPRHVALGKRHLDLTLHHHGFRVVVGAAQLRRGGIDHGGMHQRTWGEQRWEGLGILQLVLVVDHGAIRHASDDGRFHSVVVPLEREAQLRGVGDGVRLRKLLGLEVGVPFRWQRSQRHPKLVAE
mmetsp:Transcript_15678/g.43956  ORF Transcript_15678/g.43956 Transcript_15678/m.43956 type:complete len:206 (+) Transcript_15678:1990-2607(+)